MWAAALLPGYENDFYKDVKGKFWLGKRIDTPIGEGKVVKISVLRETVTILFDDGSTVDMTPIRWRARAPERAPARPGTLTAAQESALDATMP